MKYDLGTGFLTVLVSREVPHPQAKRMGNVSGIQIQDVDPVEGSIFLTPSTDESVSSSCFAVVLLP